MKTVLIVAGIVLTVYLVYRTYRMMTLDKGLDKLISKGAIILDVRTETEFKTGHISNAVNIPLSRLHGDTVPLDKQAVIITCCSHGLRSVKAVSLLKEKGFKKVYNGGAWTDLEKLSHH